MAAGKLLVPDRRVSTLKDMLQQVLDSRFSMPARQVARSTGSLASMRLALGPVVRLWTRKLYRSVQAATCWDKKMHLCPGANSEIMFWCDNFDNTGQPIWFASPKVEVLTYFDASDTAWGGYAVELGDQTAVGSWSEESRKSS